MSKTIAFIQARMSSSRFPGKVIAPLQGMPMIAFMARRAARASLLDDVVVVTSTDSSDDALVETTKAHGLRVFRGDLHDVLRRYVDAATAFGATEVIRLTGDCPLIDPSVIDSVIRARRKADADYSSNIDPPTFPDGLDVECCTIDTLHRANSLAKTQPEREHVTLWMRSEAARLRRTNVRTLADFSHLRLTVDYPDDLDAVAHLVDSLSLTDSSFDLFDMLRELSQNPDILLMNPHARNEGLALSLQQSAGAPSTSQTPSGATT